MPPTATEALLAGIRSHGHAPVTTTLDAMVARASPFTQHLYEVSGLAPLAGTSAVEHIQPQPPPAAAAQGALTLLLGDKLAVDVPAPGGRGFLPRCTLSSDHGARSDGACKRCDLCRHPLQGGEVHTCSFVAAATALAVDSCTWARASPHQCRGMQRVSCEALAAALDAEGGALVRLAPAQWAACACPTPGLNDALETPSRKLFVPARTPEPVLVRVQYDAAPALRATLTTASADHAECAAYALVQIARAVSRVDDVAADLDDLDVDADSGTVHFFADTLHAVAVQLARRVGAALQDAPGVDCGAACFFLERLAWDLVFACDRHAVLGLTGGEGAKAVDTLRLLRAHELPPQHARRAYADEFARAACDQALWSGFELVRSLGWPVSYDAVTRAFLVRRDEELPKGGREFQEWAQHVFAVFAPLYPRRRNPGPAVVRTLVTRDSVAALQHIVIALGCPFEVHGARDPVQVQALPGACGSALHRGGVAVGRAQGDAGAQEGENIGEAHDALFQRRHALRLRVEARESKRAAVAARLTVV